MHIAVCIYMHLSMCLFVYLHTSVLYTLHMYINTNERTIQDMSKYSCKHKSVCIENVLTKEYKFVSSSISFSCTCINTTGTTKNISNTHALLNLK